ncbi:hypothetical protein ACIPPS_31850 [Streptomyces sp. NPDC090127]|uniref:hypothetical protein n=1 Tax=Streptomyces sp. NPDC090127 TaxID=3365953 RepID=UPI003830BCD9
MADLKNIALTIEAERVAVELARGFPATDRMDFARLGFAYAVREGMSLERDGHFGNRGGSNYNSAGIDVGGSMAEAVSIFYPDEASSEPYRAIETLMNKGLVVLGEHLEQGIIGSIGDLMPEHSPS